MVKLGVNLDHVATIRQQRYTPYPDMLTAIKISEESGADSITMHLREDRRHIQFDDIKIARKYIQTKLNLEMAPTQEMCEIANQVKPDFVCIVPEKRQELTTEGGLDVAGQEEHIRAAVERLQKLGTEVSLFIDPDEKQIDATMRTGAPVIELHTGRYADAENEEEQLAELKRIQHAAAYAQQQGLIVNAGHGLNYHNVEAIAAIPGMNELNIGHAIIARAVFTGLKDAVAEMRDLLEKATVR